MKQQQRYDQPADSEPPSDELWDVKTVARFLNLSHQTIYRWVSEKRIPNMKIYGALRFDPKQIRHWTLTKKFNRVS